ncbi:MAG TPA: carbohydrate kinase family protein, partial [Rubellimicrobium sp.]|nr:carbohydrate kinase family protein [Rubellimicrobium sp.]
MRPLATLGNVNVDLIMGPTTPWPTPGTEVLVAHDELRPGGAAGNTALAWAGLGVPFTIASNVGDDAFGVWLINAFRPYSEAWTTSPCRTTVSVGLTHPGDERTFFTTRGHLPELGWNEARPQLEDLYGGLLLLSGTFLMDRLVADYAALFTWAADRGVEIALDPGWPPAGWTTAELDRA